jgi:hypothetical protein
VDGEHLVFCSEKRLIRPRRFSVFEWVKRCDGRAIFGSQYPPFDGLMQKSENFCEKFRKISKKRFHFKEKSDIIMKLGQEEPMKYIL